MTIFELLTKDHFELIVDEDLNFDKGKLAITKEFLNFCCKFLELKTSFTCKIVSDRESNGLATLAYYAPDDNLTVVYGKDRMLGDIMRSIAHELVHHQQNEAGKLDDTTAAGSDGSDIENEANARAGVIMRKFGKAHQEIYK